MTKVFLTIVAGMPPKKYALNANRVTIGNGAGNSIDLSPSSTAQTYCTINRLDGNNYMIEDSHQQGNIYVNGERISSQQLASGDTIQIGSIVAMKYEITEDVPMAAVVSGTKSSAVGQHPPARAHTQTAEKRISTITPSALAPSRSTAIKAKEPPQVMTKSAGNGKTSMTPRKTTVVADVPDKGIDKKQYKTFFIAAAIIAVILVVIFMIKGKSGPTQQELTKELFAANEKAKALIIQKKIIDADVYLEKIIEDPKYKNAVSLPDIKKSHSDLHDAADNERKALAEVTKFKEKLDKVYESANISVRAAEQLLDECNSLIGKHSYSNQKTELQEMKAQIEKTIAEGSGGTGELPKIKNEVARLLGESDNNYSAAITFLDASKAKYADSMFLSMGIKSELDRVNMKAKSEFNQKIKDNVARLKKDNKSADANNILNEALPRFKGTDCYKDIEQLKQGN